MTSWANKPMPAFNQHLGFEIEQWQHKHIKMRASLKPEHLNRSGIPHGGYISALLDACTALSGAYSDDPDDYRKALTLSLNINYLGQAQSHDLYALGKVTASGRNIYYASGEVYDALDNLIATAQGVFRYRSETSS
ncbi:MAG: hypothetical protein CL579_11830 [Alteromonadaceae bacterium]|nr:hypothetical protein [Alteromonadaceae bacterium]MBB18075.1 hypothetical protein [Rickettsiales bacterium]